MDVTNEKINEIKAKGPGFLRNACTTVASISLGVVMAMSIAQALKVIENGPARQKAHAELMDAEMRATQFVNYFRSGESLHNDSERTLDYLLGLDGLTLLQTPRAMPEVVDFSENFHFDGTKLRALGSAWDTLKLRTEDVRAFGQSAPVYLNTVSSNMGSSI